MSKRGYARQSLRKMRWQPICPRARRGASRQNEDDKGEDLARLVGRAEGGRIEAVAAVAELARHPHLAVDHHVLQIFAGEAPQQLLDALARAAAIGLKADRPVSAHLLFMEQPVEQPVGRKQW